MNIFGIGLPEMAVILVIALLIFGPKKLPEIGRSLGKAIRGFQDASREFEQEFQRESRQIEEGKQPEQSASDPAKSAAPQARETEEATTGESQPK